MKKMFLIFVIFTFAGGTSFAYDEYSQKNCITIDAYGLLIGPAVSMSFSLMSVNVIWTSLQYERFIGDNLSLAGRIGYRGAYLIDYDYNEDRTFYTGLSLEAHFRYYAISKKYFFDGMLGYGLLHYFDDWDINRDIVSNYFLYGLRGGWRIDFGHSNGFILEPSFGLNVVLGRRNRYLEERDIIARWLIVGGPQVSVAVGYSF